MEAALGPLADDADAMALLRAVLQPTFYDALRTGGRSTDEVSAFVAAVITPWLVERDSAARRGDGGNPLGPRAIRA